MEFYARLETTEIMPTISQTTLVSFKKVFEPLIADGIEIVTIVGSTELSATMNSSEQSKAMFPDATIEIIDSLGEASRLLGTALNLKPLLELRDGRVEAVEKIRTKAKARTRLLGLIEERLSGKSQVRLSVLHAATEEEARQLNRINHVDGTCVGLR